jgi:hypothetical protein
VQEVPQGVKGPLLGLRFHDLRFTESTVDEVSKGQQRRVVDTEAISRHLLQFAQFFVPWFIPLEDLVGWERLG